MLFGPYQSECLQLLRQRNTRFLAGNTEREVLDETDETNQWCARQLSDQTRHLIRGWPASIELEIEHLGHVFMCHGSPRSDEEILTILTPDQVAAVAVSGVAADVVVIGHTHQQFERQVGRIRLVNAGSVGLPYEGKAGAYWIVLGPDIEFRHTSYNTAAAVEQLRASGMPGIDEILLESLLKPAPREEITAYFERRAGRGE